MKSAALIRTLVGLLVLALLGWVIYHTRWEEIEVDDPARGAAATDQDYVLRKIVASAGATLEARESLEPLPPAGATLVLESRLWNIFPERDARLKAWVEAGGHLVMQGGLTHKAADLAWVPLSTVTPREGRHAASASARASDPFDPDTEDGDEQPRRETTAQRLLKDKPATTSCWDVEEPASIATPAFERGRIFRGCAALVAIRTLNHVDPTWALQLAHTPSALRAPFTPGSRMLAMRVAVGRGDVTAMTPFIASYNRGLLEGDNALIVAAILQAAPGRAVWIVRDEAREPLLGWMWHEARTPSLLALAAIALALWRLMLRFGPREAVPPQARRSMGEQVRGTGHFIAGSDPRALHAATRQAFEAAARRRVEGWAELDDDARIEALAATLRPAQSIDRAALRAAMNIGGGATPTQILAATAVLEQARRALLRAHAAPPG